MFFLLRPENPKMFVYFGTKLDKSVFLLKRNGVRMTYSLLKDYIEVNNIVRI